MPKTVVVIAATDTTNAPTIANGAGQRAASHNNSGRMKASGSNEIQVLVGWANTYAASNATMVSKAAPSIVSRLEGGSAHARRSSMMSGPTTMVPIPWDSSQMRQTSQNGASVCSKV